MKERMKEEVRGLKEAEGSLCLFGPVDKVMLQLRQLALVLLLDGLHPGVVVLQLLFQLHVALNFTLFIAKQFSCFRFFD